MEIMETLKKLAKRTTCMVMFTILMTSIFAGCLFLNQALQSVMSETNAALIAVLAAVLVAVPAISAFAERFGHWILED